MKTITPYSSVELLNLPEKDSLATITTVVNGHLNIGKDFLKCRNYRIIITDCRGKIELHGGLKTPEERKNALHKVDTLINELILLKKQILKVK